ncbi:MAG TPA: hypothetical protein VNJ70_03270 [Thermoanaerobaculia bacterium]|nr:hypothetical protein [Thermoanaerobaculia bacterium]
MDEGALVEAGFRKALDRHGYGFQYAVLRHVQELRKQGSPWYPVVAEFGVEAKGRDTRIDFVLHNNLPNIFLVCECKRANPAVANWCFAQADWPQKDYYSGTSSASVVRRTSEGHVLATRQGLLPTQNAYQVGLEVRTGDLGDTGGSGRGEIEDAATQVCRGLNGLMEFLRDREDLLPRGKAAAFVPAVFTTASLWSSSVDLGTAEISTGRLTAENVKLDKSEWLWFDYPQSPGITHSILHASVRSELTDAFYAEALRRIAIVSADGIRAFLESGLWTFRGPVA